MSAELLSSVSGIVLSLVFSYVPGVKEWFEPLANKYKQSIIGGLLVVVAASIFGGLVIASPTKNSMACMKLLPSKPVDVVVVVPDFHVLTNDARAVLPKLVDIQDAVFNIGRASLLVAALATGDFRLLGIAADDKLHQPYREKLIPGMKDVFEAARSVDKNVAVALSGAGPSIVAFYIENGVRIGESMRRAFHEHDIDSRVMILNIDEEGAMVR